MAGQRQTGSSVATSQQNQEERQKHHVRGASHDPTGSLHLQLEDPVLQAVHTEFGGLRHSHHRHDD